MDQDNARLVIPASVRDARRLAIVTEALRAGLPVRVVERLLFWRWRGEMGLLDGDLHGDATTMRSDDDSSG